MMKINRCSLVIITVSFILLSSLAACNNKGKVSPGQPDTAYVLKQADKPVKWNLDEATRKNIGKIKSIINNPDLQTGDYSSMIIQLQSQVDTLVSECTMKGPAHEALHVWLEQFITDLKKLKTPGNQKTPAYQQLRKDIENFDKQFAW